jgi:hypothetical protein
VRYLSTKILFQLHRFDIEEPHLALTVFYLVRVAALLFFEHSLSISNDMQTGEFGSLIKEFGFRAERRMICSTATAGLNRR